MRKYIIAAPVLIILVVLLIFQLRSLGVAEPSVKRAVARKLEKTYAEYRARLLSDIHYALTMDLTKNEDFAGTVKVDFTLLERGDVTLDFFSGEVTQVAVNGKKLDTIDYNGFFITLPRKKLQSGKNTVEVNFKHEYGKTGTGLYRFVDPVDQKIYLYSDFEPYDANAMFPCFDQPDLKATYKSVVLAPKDWQVVSTTLEENRAPNGENQQWTFPESKKISTYVYSLHAGPYAVWKSEIKTSNHLIPLRLFARQSIAKYVDPEEWFSTTRQGLGFYENYFDFAYAFQKYDQLIVPDFNSGAMENVGAVTFNEQRFISRGVKDRAEKRRLAEVILHEMGHMWFGDLVTMKWWNDIWLNESFATYIATLAMASNTPYTEAWVDFAMSEKQRALHEDQLVTTHPIEFTVADTDVVFANFDGITYGKGASVLKQLAFYIGAEHFQKGLQDYFKLYSYQNTTIAEFMNQLTKASAIDLNPWQSAWLQTAQVNTVKVDYTCKDGKITGAKLLQTAPKEYPNLRPHRTLVGLLVREGKKLVTKPPLDISYYGPQTELTGLEGADCTNLALIYPNLEDHDYVRVELDEKSIETVKANLSDINDEILRIGLWTSLWDMVIDKKISMVVYLDTFLKNSLTEKSHEVLRVPLSHVNHIVDYLLPRDEAWKIQRAKIAAQVAQHFLKATKQASDLDLQKQWFDAYTQIAEQPADLKILSEALNKKPTWLKFDLDQERRWNIVKSLNQYAYGDYKKILAAEKVKDSSDRGVKSALAAEVSQPDIEVKKEFWQKIAKGPTPEMTLAQLRPLIGNIFPQEQKGLQAEFRQDFYKVVRDLSGKPGEFLSYFANMAPAFCATESVNELNDFAAKNQDLSPVILKHLKIEAQESERCVGIRAKATETKLL